jgi:Flp pilus assembly protein TadG
MRRTDRRSRERGTLLMELALVMPFLILTLMMVLEGSRLVRTHQVLNNAAREGARLSVLPDNCNACPGGAGSIDEVKTAVIHYASQNGITLTADNITIDQTVVVATASGTSFQGSRVTVNYSYSVGFLSVFSWLGVPGTYTLQAGVVFQNFYSST